MVVDASMYLQAAGEGGQKSTHQVICGSDWMHRGCGENAEAVGIDALHATAVGDIPGEKNVFADVPSRIYSDELNGIMRAESEYVGKDDEDSEGDDLPGTTRPLYTGSTAIVPTRDPSAAPRRSTRLADLGAEKRTYTQPRAMRTTTTPKAKPQKAPVRKAS